MSVASIIAVTAVALDGIVLFEKIIDTLNRMKAGEDISLEEIDAMFKRKDIALSNLQRVIKEQEARHNG